MKKSIKIENKTKYNKSKTYIHGFDNLIEGGFEKSSSIILLGEPGVGKTIFSLEYLYNGAKYENDVGIYFTFEEKKDSLIKQAAQFGWDLVKLEKENKLKIISISSQTIDKYSIDDMITIIKKSGAKRCVIDSITTLSYITPKNSNDGANEYQIKNFIYNFITKFNQIKDLTTIFISQKEEVVSNSVAKYISDAIIDIEYESLGGEYSRMLKIKKMRQTNNDTNLHPLEINSKQGIIIHNL